MKIAKFLISLAAGALIALPAFAVELKIGLQDDADALDPAQSRTFVGRIVYTALCDKLVDVTPDLKFVPQLATSWKWSADGKQLTMELRQGVKFQDETPLNAEAVVYTIQRNMTMPESRRKSELSSVDKVEATGEYEVTFTLKAPDVTLLAQLSDRAGMIVSPTAAKAAGAKFGDHPVCAGPFKFVERVQQDRIVLEKFQDYWNKDDIFIDKVTYLPIPDTTVRLANLRSGDLDMIERVAASTSAPSRATPTSPIPTPSPPAGWGSMRTSAMALAPTIPWARTSACVRPSRWRSTAKLRCKSSSTALPLPATSPSRRRARGTTRTFRFPPATSTKRRR